MMGRPTQTFDPIASAIELHAHLAVALRNRGTEVDLVFHGRSGMISVFATRHWLNVGHGKGAAICDIYPTQKDTWLVEWLDGSTMNGSGGNFAFTKMLTDRIEDNLKWTVG